MRTGLTSIPIRYVDIETNLLNKYFSTVVFYEEFGCVITQIRSALGIIMEYPIRPKRIKRRRIIYYLKRG